MLRGVMAQREHLGLEPYLTNIDGEWRQQPCRPIKGSGSLISCKVITELPTRPRT
jgi:hypothetical protein